MRIIAGKYRGRKLAEFFNDTTRPTTDRVKENVFNVLSNIINFDGASVLDLFAGTGQYGIECLSRGASFVAFNDVDAAAVSVIKKNLRDVHGNYMIINKEYPDALTYKKYDLIFLDPPYATELGIDAIKIIVEKKLLTANGVIVFETDKADLTFGGFSVTTKKYGTAYIYFLVS